MTENNDAPSDDSIDTDTVFTEVKNELTEQRMVKVERPALAFVVLMLGLAAILTTLGVWQLARLSEKQVLIARVENRLQDTPRVLPPAREWHRVDPDKWDFRPVKIIGSFEYDRSIFVFTNLTQANGRLSGPGYWVVTPFLKEGGGTVLVNRGFIPQDLKSSFEPSGNSVEEVMTITGIARASERVNAFTPGPDYEERTDWITNTDRLQNFLRPKPDLVAPFFVAQFASSEVPLPQGGETKVELPNRHMQYAITWFSLAGMVPILLIFWIFRKK